MNGPIFNYERKISFNCLNLFHSCKVFFLENGKNIFIINRVILSFIFLIVCVSKFKVLLEKVLCLILVIGQYINNDKQMSTRNIYLSTRNYVF
jgi:hypothetical protein